MVDSLCAGLFPGLEIHFKLFTFRFLSDDDPLNKFYNFWKPVRTIFYEIVLQFTLWCAKEVF